MSLKGITAAARAVLPAFLAILVCFEANTSMATGIRTVAVSYFDNTGGNADLDPLRKGLADMLITDLSNVKAIRIVEREKLEAILKEIRLGEGKFIDPATAQRLGKGLGAQYVLTGSYVEQGSLMRIDARLVRVESGEIIMAEQVTGGKGEFFAMEKDLANLLVSRLGVNLTRIEKVRLDQVPTESFGAVLSYSKGLDALDRNDNADAERNLTEAIRLDPEFDWARRLLEKLTAVLQEVDAAEVRDAAAKLLRVRAVLSGGSGDATQYEFLLGRLGRFRETDATKDCEYPGVFRIGGSLSDWASVLLNFLPSCSREETTRPLRRDPECRTPYDFRRLREYLLAKDEATARALRWTEGSTECLLQSALENKSGSCDIGYLDANEDGGSTVFPYGHIVADTCQWMGEVGYIDEALDILGDLRRSPRMNMPLDAFVDTRMEARRKRCMEKSRGRQSTAPGMGGVPENESANCESSSARRSLKRDIAYQRFLVDYREAQLLISKLDLAGAAETLQRAIAASRVTLDGYRFRELNSPDGAFPFLPDAIALLRDIQATLLDEERLKKARRQYGLLMRRKDACDKTIEELRRGPLPGAERSLRSEEAWRNLRAMPGLLANIEK